WRRAGPQMWRAYAAARGTPQSGLTDGLQRGFGEACGNVSRGNFARQMVSFGGWLHAQHDGQQFPATAERVERLGLVAGRGERAHQPAIKRLGEVVGFEPAPVHVDGGRKI